MVRNRIHGTVAALTVAALLLPAGGAIGASRRPGTRPAAERPLLPVVRDRQQQERERQQQEQLRRLQREFNTRRVNPQEVAQVRREQRQEARELRREQRDELRFLQRSQPPQVHEPPRPPVGTTGPSAFPNINPVVIVVGPGPVAKPPRPDGRHSRRF